MSHANASAGPCPACNDHNDQFEDHAMCCGRSDPPLGGRDAALDVTVIHPLQAATVAGIAANPGSDLKLASDCKELAAGELCRRQGLASSLGCRLVGSVA